MIKINLEHALKNQAIEKYSKQVKEINQKMTSLESEGFEFLGWKDLPVNYNKTEFANIKKEAKRLTKEGVEILVVIGIGGSYLGSKAGIDFVQGVTPMKRKMEVVFIGNSLSSTDLAQKLAYVSSRPFAINVISKSGTTTEPALAFRLFRKLLEDKVGVNNASKFIIATTDANKGALLDVATQNGYTKFIIPDNIGGRFSVLTPVGLFPMACAGIDIDKVMEGAKIGRKTYESDSLKENDAYKYAVARFLLGKTFKAEMLVSYEPSMQYFNEWWKQLFGESEGKMSRGLLPTSSIFSTDLHSLGQFIQDGSKVLFETVVTVKRPTINLKVIESSQNLDNLNYLSKLTVHDINQKAFEGVRDAHVLVGKVPNIHLEIDKMDEKNLGQLFYFFMRSCAMSAYLLGVNPFDQPGVEVYKSNLFKLLGKDQK